jgi:uncharacterized protein (TIGR04562 family)
LLDFKKEINFQNLNKTSSSANLLENWLIPWEEFETVLGSKTLYDLRGLNLQNQEDAEIFLKHCGFDLRNPHHIKEFDRFFGEALFFMRHHLLTEEERRLLPLPPSFHVPLHPTKLLLLASDKSPRKRYMRLFSCALLKLIYVIANIEYSGKFAEIEPARELIFERINSLLKDNSTLCVHPKNKANPIKLAHVDWKEFKSRSSLIMKLVHKPETVVDEIFDYLGVRFVVYSLNDIPKLLKNLIDADIIIPHQVVRLRTRNNILNVEESKKILTFCKDLLSHSIIDEQEFESMCLNMKWGTASLKKVNTFSHEHYRSLQVTVRHLVRTPNQAYTILESFANQLRRYRVKDSYEPWIENVIPPTISRYFPIEIQIMDKESYDIAQFGPASHEKYKQQQLQFVRKRVLGGLLYFTNERLHTQHLA